MPRSSGLEFRRRRAARPARRRSRLAPAFALLAILALGGATPALGAQLGGSADDAPGISTPECPVVVPSTRSHDGKPGIPPACARQHVLAGDPTPRRPAGTKRAAPVPCAPALMRWVLSHATTTSLS